jgi:hypothetical protein
LNFVRFKIATKDWGDVLIARPIPQGDNVWGCLDGVQDTVIGKLIPVIDGETFSHAMQGHTLPLLKKLGPEPRLLMRKIPEDIRICKSFKACLMADKTNCYPCEKMPDCYIPPKIPIEIERALVQVLLAWRDGYYVVVVGYGEFSLG